MSALRNRLCDEGLVLRWMMPCLRWMMSSLRYKRFVPSVFRDLRRQHRLSHPNQWLGSVEQSVRRTDEVFRSQVQETVQKMLGSAPVPEDQGSAPRSRKPDARTGSGSRTKARDQSPGDSS